MMIRPAYPEDMRWVAPILGVVMAAATLTTAPTAQARPCPVSLPGTESGSAAVRALGDDLATVAAGVEMTADALRQTLRTDRTLHVDTCGRLFYADPVPDSVPAQPEPDALEPGTDVFALHSRPGSRRTIYLDFTGHEITDSAWSKAYGSFTGLPYSIDNDTSSFNATEQARIADVWRRVAEDYAPFNVDVTTEEPPAAALTRSSAADLVFGTRVAILGGDNPIYPDCDCGGIAYLGAFDNFFAHDYYQPAFVFVKGVGTGSKTIAEAASHESGHNFNLNHDGAPLVEYFGGHNVWAPIMGNSYGRPVTQWSRGEYTGANNTEDDLATIAARGAPLVADDVGDTRATATALEGTASGLIGTATDVDYFSFTARSGTTITVEPAPVSPDLDASLTLYDSNGLLVATSDPASAFDTSDIATGMDATISRTLTSGTYYVKVDGVGARSAATNGYSDYASLGRYDLTVLTDGSPLSVAAATPPVGMVRRSFSASFKAVGGTGPYTLTRGAGMLPPGLTLSPAGDLTGTPTTAGTYMFTVQATDSVPNSASRAFTVTITPALVVGSAVPTAGMVGQNYSHPFTTTGGTAPVTFSVGAGNTPPGLSLGADGRLAGTPEDAGTYTFQVWAADANGFSATRDVTVVVEPGLADLTGDLPVATVGAPYSARIMGGGGAPPYTYSVRSGSLPPGLTLAPDGELSGVPGSSGRYSFVAAVTDSRSRQIGAGFALTVVPALQLVNDDVALGRVAAAYDHEFSATGGVAPYTFTAFGTLPPGVTMTTGGRLSGTPRSAGSYRMTVTVEDSNGTSASRSVTLVIVDGRVSVVSRKLPTATAGRKYSVRLRSSAPGTWRMTSRVRGLRMSPTGRLVGTPKRAGRYRITVTVAAGTESASRRLLLRVRKAR